AEVARLTRPFRPAGAVDMVGTGGHAPSPAIFARARRVHSIQRGIECCLLHSTFGFRLCRDNPKPCPPCPPDRNLISKSVTSIGGHGHGHIHRMSTVQPSMSTAPALTDVVSMTHIYHLNAMYFWQEN